MTIPADATVTIVQRPLNGTRFVDVVWNCETAIVFASDLEAHVESSPKIAEGGLIGFLYVLLGAAMQAEPPQLRVVGCLKRGW